MITNIEDFIKEYVEQTLDVEYFKKIGFNKSESK